MDDIQFWIYVIFAIIYFVARNFKKASKKPTGKRSATDDQQEQPQVPQPQSFEELLEEITGRRSVRQTPPPEEDNAPEAIEDERYLQPKPWEEKERKIEHANEFEREGRNRKFADDESRRVYEESIKRAEGAEIDYSVDEKFASKKVLRSTAEEVEENHFAKEIKEMLQNSDSARKAVILGEILNRRY
jgi:PAB1-binding protein PBP1